MYDFTLLDANDTLPAKHEGILTKQYGVLPPKGIPTKMPSSHSAWDTAAASLPRLVQSNTATQILKQLPILDASEESFSDEYLSLASIILNSLARAYYYHSTENDLRNREATDPLPDAITKPWQQISTRLNRNVPVPSRTIYDSVLCNWKITNPAIKNLAELQLNDIELLVPIVGNKEERIFFLSIFLMELKFSPAIYHMIEAQNNVALKNDNEIIHNLDAIIRALNDVTQIFSAISQNSTSSTHVDPKHWAGSVIKIEKGVRVGEKDGSGASSPLFHFMDAFIQRTYLSELGKQLLSYRSLFPEQIQKLITFIGHEDNAVLTYVQHSTNTKLKEKFQELTRTYTDLLSKHKAKAVSYFESSIEAGRKVTHGGQSDIIKVDQVLASAIEERKAVIAFTPTEAHVISNRPLAEHVHEIILRLPKESIGFKPGDKCLVSPQYSAPRLYSIAPVVESNENEIRLTVKSCGKTSAHLCSLKPNDRLKIEKADAAPFELPQDNSIPIIMFAGGTGISSFLGFIDERSKSKHSKNILFFSTQDKSRVYYKDKLDAHVAEGTLDYQVIFSRETSTPNSNGYIQKLIEKNAKDIAELIRDKKAQIYICGSAAFADTVKTGLDAIPGLQYHAHQDVFTHNSLQNMRELTVADLEKSKADKLWIVLNNFIYDLTAFAFQHPGGKDVLLKLAGKFADGEYARAHGHMPSINSHLENFKIGVLKREKITIVGGGLSGIVLAAFLAKENKNFDITVYDNLPDPRDVLLSENRSINITLCERGLIPLGEIGVRDDVLKQCVRVKGRMIHSSDSHVTEQLYGNNGESLYSINRAILAKTLLISVSEQYPAITFHYNHTCEKLDLPNTTATFKDSTGSIVTVKSDRILGADGVGSKVRSHLEALIPVEKTQYQHHQAYKEIKLPADADGFPLNPNYLHIWPRDDFMLIGFPNTNGSFTLSFFFPAHNPPQDYDVFFKTHFPDIHEKIRESLKAAASHPVGRMTTLRCSPWIYEDKVALIGDAAHAIFPYFGQGANSAFEDCKVLMQCYRQNPGNWGAILNNYQIQRKPNTDVISHLAENHFTTLSHNVGDSVYLEKQKIALLLQHKEKKSSTLYHNIAFTDMPYKEAKAHEEQFNVRVEMIQERLTERLPRPERCGSRYIRFMDTAGLLFFANPRNASHHKTPHPSSLQLNHRK